MKKASKRTTLERILVGFIYGLIASIAFVGWLSFSQAHMWIEPFSYRVMVGLEQGMLAVSLVGALVSAIILGIQLILKRPSGWFDREIEGNVPERLASRELDDTDRGS